MKYKNILIILIITIVVATVLFRISNVSQETQQVPSLTQEQSTLPSKTSSEGTIRVKVTPENLSQNLVFAIALDTHMGSLDQDLTKQSMLIDEQGNVTPAIRWEGDPVGGHHREGVLQFSSFPKKPKSITLLLKDIGGVSQRKFTWTMER